LELGNIKDLTAEEIEKYSQPLEDEESVGEDKFKDDILLLSLKKVLDFYYGEISTETIINFTHHEAETFTPAMAVDVCFSMGLNAVHKDLKATEIAHYFLPCIIIDKEGNPYVYLSKAMREISLFNPKTGEIENFPAKNLKNFNKAIHSF
jgi:ATP-binding cassette subfamily B protein/ATP-binding cassette subfamily C protein LapB